GGDAWKGLTDLQEQRARAASDVQDVVPGRERRLVDQRSTGAVAAEQLRQRIVEGQEQVAAGRGKEVSVRPGLFAHVMQSNRPPVRIPDRLVPSSVLRRSRRGYFFGFFGRFFSAARFLAA